MVREYLPFEPAEAASWEATTQQDLELNQKLRDNSIKNQLEARERCSPSIRRPGRPRGAAGRCPEQLPGIAALQDPLHLRQLLRILGQLDRNFTELDVRRAFTVFQLMTILEENHHSFLIVEHDPLLYEDAREMVEYLAQALKQTSR